MKGVRNYCTPEYLHLVSDPQQASQIQVQRIQKLAFLHFRFCYHISGFARFARFANNVPVFSSGHMSSHLALTFRTVALQLGCILSSTFRPFSRVVKPFMIKPKNENFQVCVCTQFVDFLNFHVVMLLKRPVSQFSES